MYESYVAAVIIYLLSLLAAGVVFIVRARGGSVSIKKIVAFIAALTVLEISAFICMWASFVIAGGPDGNFLSAETLFFGGVGILISLFTAMFALWLISMPYRLSALVLAPPVLMIGAGIARFWSAMEEPFATVMEETFLKGPLTCLVVIVALWVWRELRAPAS